MPWVWSLSPCWWEKRGGAIWGSDAVVELLLEPGQVTRPPALPGAGMSKCQLVFRALVSPACTAVWKYLRRKAQGSGSFSSVCSRWNTVMGMSPILRSRGHSCPDILEYELHTGIVWYCFLLCNFTFIFNSFLPVGRHEKLIVHCTRPTWIMTLRFFLTVFKSFVTLYIKTLLI